MSLINWAALGITRKASSAETPDVVVKGVTTDFIPIENIQVENPEPAQGEVSPVPGTEEGNNGAVVEVEEPETAEVVEEAEDPDNPAVDPPETDGEEGYTAVLDLTGATGNPGAHGVPGPEGDNSHPGHPGHPGSSGVEYTPTSIPGLSDYLDEHKPVPHLRKRVAKRFLRTKLKALEEMLLYFRNCSRGTGITEDTLKHIRAMIGHSEWLHDNATLIDHKLFADIMGTFFWADNPPAELASSDVFRALGALYGSLVEDTNRDMVDRLDLWGVAYTNFKEINAIATGCRGYFMTDAEHERQ